jgi:hypothetical protein
MTGVDRDNAVEATGPEKTGFAVAAGISGGWALASTTQ